MDSIGIELGFQGNAAVAAITHAALARLPDEIAGIELDAGQVGVNGHGSAGNRVGKHGAGIAEHLKIVVIAALQVQRLLVSLNVLTNGLGHPEVHGGAPHAAHFTGGDALGIGNAEGAGGQHQQLVYGGLSVCFACQIEIAVVGEVKDGVPVAHSIIGNVQAAGFVQAVGHVNGGVAGVALVSGGAVQAEGDAGVGAGGDRPQPGVVEVGAGMEVVAVFVGGQAVFPPAQGKGAALDAVGTAPHNRAEEAAARQVVRRVVIAQDNVNHVAVCIGHKDTDQGCAQVGYGGGDAAAGDGV